MSKTFVEVTNEVQDQREVQFAYDHLKARGYSPRFVTTPKGIMVVREARADDPRIIVTRMEG